MAAKVAKVAKFAKKKTCAFHFPAISLFTLYKPCNLTGCFVLVFLFDFLGQGCNLEQKIVRVVNSSHF